MRERALEPLPLVPAVPTGVRTVTNIDPVEDSLVGNVGLGLVSGEPVQDVGCLSAHSRHAALTGTLVDILGALNVLDKWAEDLTSAYTRSDSAHKRRVDGGAVKGGLIVLDELPESLLGKGLARWTSVDLADNQPTSVLVTSSRVAALLLNLVQGELVPV